VLDERPRVEIALVAVLTADDDVVVGVLVAAEEVDVEVALAVPPQQATGRRAFVDMFSRFSAANHYLHEAVADLRYWPLTFLEIEGCTALLWPGYELTLQTLALDMMHADFDLITGLIGRPTTVDVAGTDSPAGRGSAAAVLLGYPDTVVRCTSSALMPKPYGMRGGRAAFPGAVLEYATSAGFTPAKARPPSPSTPPRASAPSRSPPPAPTRR
jgi:hypothetical protein